ncbi:hypothetical protein K2173_000624 [Erythroxylum novogranatense]|uniref:Uncharacterized protein n=1 Tax=Erythroxylum novogranatense TaxID=1862640 RepID=A0AAV8S846_9ROSI|nr:hypothetical protein K2173_000624 [Erythroxylum novogranatense]
MTLILHMACTFSTSQRYKQSERILYSLWRVLAGLAWVFAALFIGNALLVTDYKDIHRQIHNEERPHGSETLPKGIVTATSDLEMRALWGNHKMNPENQTNLLGMAVGIKQKESVDKIVRKFLSSGFVIMLFHYDGNVDAWKDFEWSDRCIHVSAVSQTKWWFAKRFLHPDIVSEYEYIFLWDEDLGVEHFNATRYLSIIKEEGLHISQPALGPNSTDVHHALTRRKPRDRVHRRVYQKFGGTKCTEDSTGPPCAGFVEMMAPVFSKASWRCAWHMIPNDLVHGWGVDFRLGYCAQGKPTENVGVVDSEYVVHNSVPSLGGGFTSDKVSQLSVLEPSCKQYQREVIC